MKVCTVQDDAAWMAMREFARPLPDTMRDVRAGAASQSPPEIDAIIRVLSNAQRTTAHRSPILVGYSPDEASAIAAQIALHCARAWSQPDTTMPELWALDVDALLGARTNDDALAAFARLRAASVPLRRRVVLYVGDLPRLLGADVSHPIDLYTQLHPALWRGDLRLIATATLSEYQHFIEQHAGLAARMTPVISPAPGR